MRLFMYEDYNLYGGFDWWFEKAILFKIQKSGFPMTLHVSEREREKESRFYCERRGLVREGFVLCIRYPRVRRPKGER